MTDTANTNIKLDPDSLAVLVQKAVIDSITPEQREELVVTAIKNLLTIPEDTRPSYARSGPGPKSLLQSAFDNAIGIAAQQLVRESIAEDPKVAEAIRKVVHPVIDDLCKGNYRGLPERVGEAFATWLQERR